MASGHLCADMLHDLVVSISLQGKQVSSKTRVRSKTFQDMSRDSKAGQDRKIIHRKRNVRKHPMRAEMLFSPAEFDLTSVFDIAGLLVEGARLMSRCSHQSSSVTPSLIPEFTNHFLLPSGTKKWTFGCFALIFMIVGWSMWS